MSLSHNTIRIAPLNGHNMKCARATVFVLALAFLAPRGASAALIFSLEGASDSTLGALVTLTYNALNTFQGVLTLDITNTSESWDPRLTSFAFNTPSGVLSVSNYVSEAAGWTYTFDRNDINTPGTYGYFDVAGLSGPNFNGGDPNEGIARNEKRTFTFGLVGLGLNLLTEETFVNSLSYDPIGGPDESEQYFIARFQHTGANGQGADVATPSSIRLVPEPTALMLTALGGVGIFRRRIHTSLR